MSETDETTLILFDADGEPVDEITTSLPSEVTQLRARGYSTQDEHDAREEAAKKAAAAQKKAEEEAAKKAAAAQKKAEEEAAKKAAAENRPSSS